MPLIHLILIWFSLGIKSPNLDMVWRGKRKRFTSCGGSYVPLPSPIIFAWKGPLSWSVDLDTLGSSHSTDQPPQAAHVWSAATSTSFDPLIFDAPLGTSLTQDLPHWPRAHRILHDLATSRSGSIDATRPIKRSCLRQASNFWSVVILGQHLQKRFAWQSGVGVTNTWKHSIQNRKRLTEIPSKCDCD